MRPLEKGSAQGIQPGELARRVIYALVRPTVRIAAVFDMPLKELAALVEMAYFHELRARGLTLKETGEALSVSQRKAVRLATQLRENFLQPELEHNLPRRIEFMLWSQPMSEAQLRRVLRGVDGESVRKALDELLAGGRIEPRAGSRVVSFEPVSALRKLPRDTWMQRVGGLTSFAENLADAAFGRFFKEEPRTFARTLTFEVPQGAAEALQAWYEDEVLTKIIALNKSAEQVEERESIQLSLCWAPYEYIRSEGEGS